MLNTIYDSYQILNKVYSQKTFVKQALNNTVIEEKNRATVTKIVYGVLDKDIELSYYLQLLCDKSPKLVIRTILKIAFYSIKYLNKANYAVVTNAVELAKKLGKGATSGFINAVLRKFAKSTLELPTDSIHRMSIEYNYPQFAVKMLCKSYGEQMARQIMSPISERTAVVFYDTNLINEYKAQGYDMQSSPFPNCYFIKNFKMDDNFYQGKYTFQSVGSVAICSAIDCGKTAIDCCSAPGGKAVSLSFKFDSVVATELHEHRVGLINSYAERMNVKNITVMQADSTVFCSQFDSNFDAVLCDVPCSGYGVVKDNPDIKLNRTYEDIKSLNKTQLEILENCSQYCKVGGAVYYSTCSIFAEENQNIVSKFLAKNSNFELQKIQSPLGSLEVEMGQQFLPHISLGAGFYVCKLQRKN